MAIDLARPLIPKREPRKEFEAIQIAPDRYVLLPAGNCQPEPYSSLVVRSLGDIQEEFRNVPERRTLDCWAAVLTTPHANGYMGSLWTDKSAAKETVLGVQQHECHIHINRDYEVGEGLS